MIEFKKNVKKILPYNRGLYIEFLDDEFDSSIDWYGVSFQINKEGQKNSLTDFFETYEPLFINVISTLDNGSLWIVNHEDKDLDWFPNDENNLTSLRTLFKQREIPNTFRGALALRKNDLLNLSKDLITYPCALLYKDARLYKNIDISHAELQFIVKITGHLTIDLLSTDKILLRKIISENTLSPFVVKEYRGTSLGL